MKTRILFVLLVVLAATSVALAQDAAALPRLEPRDCGSANIPRGVDWTCGYLVVPENRQNPDSAEIRLAYAIAHSRSDTPAPDPVVSLTGGPGGITVEFLSTSLRRNYYGFLNTRDLIFFDQRGVGQSLPSLDCPTLMQFSYETAGQSLDTAAFGQSLAETLLECRETLAASGVDLGAYNTVENAADLADLRQALGYDQWNLFGVSYGTKLALATMRDDPEGLRSVILDSVYPMEANLYTSLATNQARAFDLLFETCANDAACNDAYPDLETRFYALVQRLNDDPLPVEGRHSWRGFRFNANLTGDVFAGMIFSRLYVRNLIPDLPRLIDAVDRGETGDLPRLMQDYLDRYFGIAEGMYYTVQCSEEVAFTTIEAVQATAYELHPALRPGFMADADGLFDLCASWDVPASTADEDAPVVSNIPTLLLSGEFDPITPPAWGQMAAASLENSFFYEFPTVGHGAIRSSTCARDIALDFLAEPTTTPDASCIDTMEPVAFVLR